MRVKLGEICNLQSGGTPSRGNEAFWLNGTIPWVKIGDFSGKYLKVTEECITEDGLNNSSAKLFPKGTILYTIFATLGEVCILDIDATTNQAIAGIQITENIVDRDYLYYYLVAQKGHVNDIGRGVAQNNINMSMLRNFEVPIPSISEQHKICQLLDKVSGLIAMRKKQLQKLDDLVKARFVEMFGDPELNPFGWKCLPLSTLVSVEPQNGLYKPQSDYVEDGSGIPILRIDAFYNGKVTDFQSLRRLICSDTERERYLLRENDIVINRVNSIEYLGKCAHIRGMLEDTVFESNMMRFHLNESIIDAGFAVHLLCTQYIYKQILNRAKKAVNQASINQGDVMSFQILVPPLALQKQFVTFIEQTDKSKLTIQQSLDKLELMKKALMQKYFG